MTVSKKAELDISFWSKDMTKAVRELLSPYSKNPQSIRVIVLVTITCSTDEHPEKRFELYFNPAEILRQGFTKTSNKGQIFGIFFKGMAAKILHAMFPHLSGPNAPL